MRRCPPTAHQKLGCLAHALGREGIRVIDSTGLKVEGEGEWNARKHGGTKRRVWRKIHMRCPRGGIDEQTLEIRAAEFTTSDVGDAPELLDQIPSDQEIASVTPMVPSTPASATMPSPPQVPPRSYSPGKTPSPGSPTPQGRSRATKPCAYHAASVEPSGDDGAAITAEAASKPRCIVSNCSASDWPRGTSIVRSPSSMCVLPS
jgi:hypothetical protein